MLQLLSAVPSVHVLLTATEPVDLPGRDLAYMRLGVLPDQAAVALVQSVAQGCSAEDARSLAGACGRNPLLLRMAASAVANGAHATQLAQTLTQACTPAVTPVHSVAPSPAASTTPPQLPSSAWPPGRLPTTASAAMAALAAAAHSAGQPQTAGHDARASGPAQRPTAGNNATAIAARDGSDSAATTAFERIPVSAPVTAASVAQCALHSPQHSHVPSNHSRASQGAPSHHQNTSKAMSFLLRTGGSTSSASDSLDLNGTLPSGLLALGRNVLSGSLAGIAALIDALPMEARTAAIQLSIFPGAFDEAGACAVLSMPLCAVRALLDTLMGYSMLTMQGSHGLSATGALGGTAGGCYRLQPAVQEAARQSLGDMPSAQGAELQRRCDVDVCG